MSRRTNSRTTTTTPANGATARNGRSMYSQIQNIVSDSSSASPTPLPVRNAAAAANRSFRGGNTDGTVRATDARATTAGIPTPPPPPPITPSNAGATRGSTTPSPPRTFTPSPQRTFTPVTATVRTPRTPQPAGPGPRQRETSSVVWEFFEREGSSNNYRCLLKPERRSNRGAHPTIVAGESSGNLWKHIRKYHPSVNSACDHAVAEGKDLPSTAATLKRVWNPAIQEPQQMDRFVRLVKTKLGKTLKEMSLLIWAINSSIPLSTFDTDHWKEFCSQAGIDTLGSASLTATHLPSLYNMVMDLLLERLRLASSVAITTDSWDSNGTQGKVIGIVYHYILHMPNNTLRKFTTTLDFISAPTSHTSPMIESILWSSIDSRLAENTMIASVVTDNGSNFVAAARRISADNIRCFSHTCQLVLKDFAETDDIATEIDKVQDAVVFIRNRSILSQKFRSIQPHPKELIISCATRWNSKVEMVERFVELWDFIHELSQDPIAPPEFTALLPTEVAIRKLEMFLSVANLIVYFSKWCEGDYVTISAAVPRLFEMYHTLSQTSIDTPEVKKRMQLSALDILQRRFRWIEEGVNVALMGAALDPRFGHLRFLPPTLADLVWEQLETEIQVLLGLEEDCFLPLADQPAFTMGDARACLLKTRRYFYARQASLNTDPLEWWANYKLGEPLLPLVQMIFAIPVSSASVERAFSNTGFVSSGRENLLLSHIEQMAIIRSALRDADDASSILAKLRVQAEANANA